MSPHILIQVHFFLFRLFGHFFLQLIHLQANRSPLVITTCKDWIRRITIPQALVYGDESVDWIFPRRWLRMSTLLLLLTRLTNGYVSLHPAWSRDVSRAG